MYLHDWFWMASLEGIHAVYFNIGFQFFSVTNLFKDSHFLYGCM